MLFLCIWLHVWFTCYLLLVYVRDACLWKTLQGTAMRGGPSYMGLLWVYPTPTPLPSIPLTPPPRIHSHCTSLTWFPEEECSEVPQQFQGDFFSMERGDDVNTLINDVRFENRYFQGNCYRRWDDNTTMDADGNHDSKLVFHSGYVNCWRRKFSGVLATQL